MADSFAGEAFSRSRSVVARVVAGETLIVPIRGKVGDLASIYSFNGTGTLIWKMLESPQTLKQLATGVAEAYDVDLSQAESDGSGRRLKPVGWEGLQGSGCGFYKLKTASAAFSMERMWSTKCRID